MLAEHKMIVGALRRLAAAAKQEKKPEAALLVGECIRARTGTSPRWRSGLAERRAARVRAASSAAGSGKSS